MNLELLDPFRRQVPDRIDSTLSLPETLLQAVKSSGDRHQKASSHHDKAPNKPPPPIAAHHIAFNRRGSYIAVGYANGLIAVYDILSRTVSSAYRMNTVNDDHDDKSSEISVTSLSWSRRSRTLLAGSLASPRVMLIDTTHPAGPEECGSCNNIHVPIPKQHAKDSKKGGKNDDDDDDEKEFTSTAMGVVSSGGSKQQSDHPTSFATTTRTLLDRQLTTPRRVQVRHVNTTPPAVQAAGAAANNKNVPQHRGLKPLVQALHSDSSVRRYPSVMFDMPLPIGATLQVHPKNPLIGHAVLQDGSLVVFKVPPAAFEETNNDNSEPKVLVSTVFVGQEYFLTCACLDPHGEKLYAGTRDGKLLGLAVKDLWDRLGNVADDDDSHVLPSLQPDFVIPVPGGASVWHMVVSRNGKSIVLNSADAALRLYSTVECWTTPEEVEKPLFVFQDVVNKVKFASCDISGDGEYVAGGAKGEDTKYEVYIWNTSTGVLAEKLTGSPVDLYGIAWQPTRSFLAVAASDGLVDVWGPRINWTAFAPDFQALPHNVEYVEREDEFDEVVTSGNGEKGDKRSGGTDKEDEEEKAHIDILTLHKIPVFQSDSEDEEEVFHFDVVRQPAGAMSL